MMLPVSMVLGSLGGLLAVGDPPAGAPTPGTPRLDPLCSAVLLPFRLRASRSPSAPLRRSGACETSIEIAAGRAVVDTSIAFRGSAAPITTGACSMPSASRGPLEGTLSRPGVGGRGECDVRGRRPLRSDGDLAAWLRLCLLDPRRIRAAYPPVRPSTSTSPSAPFFASSSACTRSSDWSGACRAAPAGSTALQPKTLHPSSGLCTTSS